MKGSEQLITEKESNITGLKREIMSMRGELKRLELLEDKE